MPKLKTRKVTKKRFNLTKTGKVMHRTNGSRHIRRHKSKARQRRQDSMHELTTISFVKVIKQELRGANI